MVGNTLDEDIQLLERENRKLKRRIEVLRAYLDQMRGVAHDINGPTTAIVGFSGVLLPQFPKESKVHEYRLTALFILVHKYEKANKITKKKIFDFYLSNTKYINNWDLIDLSSHKILGDFLYEKNKDILYKLAKSSSLWERRISIISTYYFIRKNNFEDTLNISKLLLNDKEDLIQKAVGWMLREVGKRNLEKEEEFLRKYYKKMPRTMLRYAIERFKEEKKGYYMAR